VSGVDVAIVSPGTPRTDPWIQEFLNHNLACVTPDFFVSFVCTPNSPLDRHVLYDSVSAVDKIVALLKSNGRAAKNQSDAEDGDVDETRCSVCGLTDREDVMLLCGDDNGNGCGIAMHIDCCNPPLAEVPTNDWFCSQCTKPLLPRQKKKPKRKAT
jgi:topoisomerase (DNA) II binding protein 1